MPCPICKCETAQTVCPNCGGNTNHARLALSKGWPVETVAFNKEGPTLEAQLLVVTKRKLEEALVLLDCINNGTDCDVTGISGCKIDGILLTREFVARVNKFLKETK